ncbi:heme-binding protein [Mycobacterium sp.]|uniref:SOUL family heme-binding protein n=1 Tax=Mycobacterium sp. TaxID=1785 RepID=UPI00128A7BF7|nr:heme-binding protein [Mycobacterium sp.]KAA8964807.1 MAG: heme-binding protein [Mycobacterium sp.]
MVKALLSLPLRLLEFGGSLVGIRHGTEEPPYTVVQQIPGAQIRRYGPRIAAETTVQSREETARTVGFRRLARYIFGANHTRAKIAMTAPVAQQPVGGRGEKIAMTAPVSLAAGGEGQWVIRFFMPADKTLESLPEPDDDAVTLVTIPEETVAVRRFTGSRSPRAIAAQTAALMRAVRDAGLEPTGSAAAWFYDPPWTAPLLRRNEVVVPVKPNL